MIECKTYRLRPHCERYQETRPQEELEYWWGRCPLKTFKGHLFKQNILDEEGARKIEEEVKAAVEQAVKFAEESPYPQPEEIFEDVYAQGAIKGGTLCVK